MRFTFYTANQIPMFYSLTLFWAYSRLMKINTLMENESDLNFK